MSATAEGIYQQTVVNNDGKDVKFAQYRNQVLLIVNTASNCGFTPQYEGLQKIYERYRKRGFLVLAFPSNDFGGQEPGSDEEIKQFCSATYKTTFPLFRKAPVKGDAKQPLYAYLTEHAPIKGEVRWNFEKFLIDRDGKIVGRYLSKVEPESAELVGAIEKALTKK